MCLVGLKTNQLPYSIRYYENNYFYKSERVGKRDYRKTEKSNKEPSNFFIKNWVGYDFSGKDNASNYVEGLIADTLHIYFSY